MSVFDEMMDSLFWVADQRGCGEEVRKEYERLCKEESSNRKNESVDDGWKEVNGRNGYRLFRKIEDGKGKWRAQKCVNGKCEGEPFDITYAQALGREPIEDKPIAELSKKLGKILLHNYDHETANDIAIRRADKVDYHGYVKEYDGTIDDMVKRELKFIATKAEYDNDRKTESVGGDDVPLRVCRSCLMGIEAHEGRQKAKHIWVDDVDDVEESKCDWCEESGFAELWEI